MYCTLLGVTDHHQFLTDISTPVHRDQEFSDIFFHSKAGLRKEHRWLCQREKKIWLSIRTAVLLYQSQRDLAAPCQKDYYRRALKHHRRWIDSSIYNYFKSYGSILGVYCTFILHKRQKHILYEKIDFSILSASY